MVDQDEYSIGLTRTRFLWLGNESRGSGSAICFTEESNGDVKRVIKSDRTGSKLLGIGIFIIFSWSYLSKSLGKILTIWIYTGIDVNNLDLSVKRMDWEKWNEIKLEHSKEKIPSRY